MTFEDIKINDEAIARLMAEDSGETEIQLSYGWFVKNEKGDWLSEFGKKPLKYYHSWDWIIPVIQKVKEIISTLPQSESQPDYILHQIMVKYEEFDRAGVYENIIQFIDWYKEYKKGE